MLTAHSPWVWPWTPTRCPLQAQVRAGATSGSQGRWHRHCPDPLPLLTWGTWSVPRRPRHPFWTRHCSSHAGSQAHPPQSHGPPSVQPACLRDTKAGRVLLGTRPWSGTPRMSLSTPRALAPLPCPLTAPSAHHSLRLSQMEVFYPRSTEETQTPEHLPPDPLLAHRQLLVNRCPLSSGEWQVPKKPLSGGAAGCMPGGTGAGRTPPVKEIGTGAS